MHGENGGTRPEAKVTMALVRSTNMATAVVVNTRTPMSNKTPGMRDFLIMVSIIALQLHPFASGQESF
ncbi:hypothetical protein HanRHA438_Chr14g0650791 [Helianthus annuus]|nr:hypothetical protein HanIR_Chr14g0694861 [Helianthus annuus]KAJ0853402.1 hypothetical protein HanRHA438_Chr14g0650791 [Helianthus annuus]